MRRVVYAIWVKLFARPRFARFNRGLFHLSLRGLGILNYESFEVSGEQRFLDTLMGLRTASDARGDVVVFDVGANQGAYAMAVLSRCATAKVYCFEPHPKTATRLRERMLNRATVIETAVGSSPGKLDLFDYADEDGSSHASVHAGVFEKIHKKAHAARSVDVTTIDDFAAKNAISRIFLLKIDTEGHELEVLKGAKKCLAAQIIDVVHFEFNEMNLVSRVSMSDYFELLTDFVFCRLLPQGSLPLKNHPLENIFAYQNIIAVRRGSAAESLFS